MQIEKYTLPSKIGVKELPKNWKSISSKVINRIRSCTLAPILDLVEVDDEDDCCCICYSKLKDYPLNEFNTCCCGKQYFCTLCLLNHPDFDITTFSLKCHTCKKLIKNSYNYIPPKPKEEIKKSKKKALRKEIKVSEDLLPTVNVKDLVKAYEPNNPYSPFTNSHKDKFDLDKPTYTLPMATPQTSNYTNAQQKKYISPLQQQIQSHTVNVSPKYLPPNTQFQPQAQQPSEIYQPQMTMNASLSVPHIPVFQPKRQNTPMRPLPHQPYPQFKNPPINPIGQNPFGYFDTILSSTGPTQNTQCQNLQRVNPPFYPATNCYSPQAKAPQVLNPPTQQRQSCPPPSILQSKREMMQRIEFEKGINPEILEAYNRFEIEIPIYIPVNCINEIDTTLLSNKETAQVLLDSVTDNYFRN
ncbi:hypothetical protein EIN_153780 [Entamoeba invadens IP1]|uniref:RING-type domain-containing protein n=1 Tax=Entamoeba invadens IP1 TaxID=370355 RepID=A0A0A1UEU4_ENTIV|nr:hypothetical protein EIN_153780 [Entamoeba invadens IP1]ELP91341.1 hypothetical protein EIN_153780 [Entamoeba invadens IP1]|eukprot:XP_004258112.1 hypothetical protein EIN_153780 [Entamoeba invadens IP1]